MFTETKASRVLQKLASPAMAAAALYALEKQAKKQDKPSLVKSLLPGAVGGIVSGSVVMPIDVASDTMRQWGKTTGESLAHSEAAHSLWKTTKQIFNESKLDPKTLSKIKSPRFAGLAERLNKPVVRGLKGFYSGYGGKMLKIAPAMALTIGTSNYIKQQMEKKNG